MQKLQSWWKVLAFGVAAAAFGLMSASCAPTEDDSEEYTVTLKGDAEYSVITSSVWTRTTILNLKPNSRRGTP